MATRQVFLSPSEHLHREYRMSCRPRQLYTPFTSPSLEVRENTNVIGPTVHLHGGLLTVHLLSGLLVPPLNGYDITPRAALCSNNILPPFNYLTLSLSFSSLFFLFFSLTHSLTHPHTLLSSPTPTPTPTTPPIKNHRSSPVSNTRLCSLLFAFVTLFARFFFFYSLSSLSHTHLSFPQIPT